jgi:hypothetical protein
MVHGDHSRYFVRAGKTAGRFFHLVCDGVLLSGACLGKSSSPFSSEQVNTRNPVSAEIPAIPSVDGKPPHTIPTKVTPIAPGATPTSLIQSMDDDLLVVHLTNISNVVDGLGPPPGFKLPNEQRRCVQMSVFAPFHTKKDHFAKTGSGQTYWKVEKRGLVCRFLMVFSTDLSDEVAGAPTRQLNITLREDVFSVRPIEPDAFQGFADSALKLRVHIGCLDEHWFWNDEQRSKPIWALGFVRCVSCFFGLLTERWCRIASSVPNPQGQQGTDAHYFPPNFKGIEGCALRWLGPRAPLRLPGGSMQLLEYTLEDDLKKPPAQAAPHTNGAGGNGGQGIGRSPLGGRWSTYYVSVEKIVAESPQL